MTSISDVFDQLVNANNTLGQIHGDVQADVAATQAVKASVDHLDGDTKSGFTATINALAAIAQIEAETAKLVHHLTQQADAMICALEKISHNTCGILTESVVQTRLQTAMAGDLDDVRYVTDSANADAVLERTRLAELRAQTERCCPPEVPPAACSYEPCPHPAPARPPRLPKLPQPRPDDKPDDQHIG